MATTGTKADWLDTTGWLWDTDTRASQRRTAGRTATKKVSPPVSRPGTQLAPPPLLSCAVAFAIVPHHALTAGTILRLVLLGIGALAVYILIVLAHPTKRCGRCHGHGLIVPEPGKRGRPKPCKRCKVTGRHYRFGATAIHRFKWSVINGRHHTRLDGK